MIGFCVTVTDITDFGNEVTVFKHEYISLFLYDNFYRNRVMVTELQNSAF